MEVSGHRKRVNSLENSTASPQNKNARVSHKSPSRSADSTRVAEKQTSPLKNVQAPAHSGGSLEKKATTLIPPENWQKVTIKSEPINPTDQEKCGQDEKSFPLPPMKKLPSEFAQQVNLSQLVSHQSEIRVGEALFTLSKLTKMYSLPDTCSEQLVRLFSSLAPQTAIYPSFDLLESADRRIPKLPLPIIQSVCFKCWSPTTPDFLCPKCPENIDVAFGIENNLAEVLKDLFENHGLAALLENNANQMEQKNKSGNLTDVTDGFRYSSLPRESKYDVSFVLSLSTGHILDSSDKEFSTLNTVLSIAELEPSVRKDVLIFASVWLLPSQRLTQKVMRNLCNSMEHLSTKGVDWMHPVTKATINSKAFLLCCAVCKDMRSFMQSLVLAWGENPCNFCEQTTFVKVPDAELDKKWDLRSHANVAKHAFAVETGSLRAEKGVLGCSPLTFVSHFDIVGGFSAEYVENLLMTVVKTSLDRCMSSTDKEYSLKKTSKSLIALRLKKVSSQRPNYLDKCHSKLDNYMSWTAKEWRNWLLFYSVPCLRGEWPNKFLGHLCFLIKGVYNLLKDEVRPEDLEQSKILLAEYCRLNKELYGETDDVYEALELHTLLHFVQNVQQCGPLWSSSAFPFQWVHDFVLEKISPHEDKNRTMENIKKIAEELNNLTSLQMLCAKARPNVDFVLTGDGFLAAILTKPEADYLNLDWGVNLKLATFYQRASVKGFTLTSHYLQSNSRSSFFLLKEVNKHSLAAKLVYFYKESDSDQVFFLAKVVELLQPLIHCDAVSLDHLRLYKDTEQYICGEIGEVDRPLLFVGKCLVVPPNIQELYL